MRSLIIDTSTERGVVAIGKDDEIQRVSHFAGLKASDFLMETVSELIEPKEIDLVICGVGPGSYTGLRVTAAVAKAIAFAVDVPLVGVSSLKGYYPENDGVFASVIDARMGGFYMQLGEVVEGDVHFQSEPKLVPVEEVPRNLPCLVGPSKEPILRRLEPSSEVIEMQPRLLAWLKEGMTRYNKGLLDDPASIEMLYLRPTQAEIERAKLDLA